jgi:hypothetical protein
MAEYVIKLTLRNGNVMPWREVAMSLSSLMAFSKGHPEAFGEVLALFKSGKNDPEAWERFYRLYSCGDETFAALYARISVGDRKVFYEATRSIVFSSFDGIRFDSPVAGMTIDEVLAPLKEIEEEFRKFRDLTPS